MKPGKESKRMDGSKTPGKEMNEKLMRRKGRKVEARRESSAFI